MSIQQEDLEYLLQLYNFTDTEKKEICVTFSIECAIRVLPIYEEEKERKYSRRHVRPREAIQAAVNWLYDPSEANQVAAYTAFRAAETAANFAETPEAADAASAAAYAACTAFEFWSYVNFAARAASHAATAATFASSMYEEHIWQRDILLRVISFYRYRQYSQILTLAGRRTGARDPLITRAGPEIMSRIKTFLP